MITLSRMVTDLSLLQSLTSFKSALANCGNRVGHGHRGESVTTFEGIVAYRGDSFNDGVSELSFEF